MTWLRSALLCSFAVVSTPGCAADVDSLDVEDTALTGDGRFTSVCDFVRHRADDPIVFPGQPGASHVHSFFGALETNAFSTYESLQGSGTSCEFAGDTAAYWIPSLLVRGAPVSPVVAKIYYNTGHKDGASIRPFPPRLQMIAGDAHARADEPQSLRVVDWACSAGMALDQTVAPHSCFGTGNRIEAHVRFPDCWDGVHVNPPDHRSHMAYSERGVCPSGWVPVPKIVLAIEWGISSADGVSLSSGGAHTLHADFYNSWDQAALRSAIDRCLHAGVGCGRL